VFWRRKRKGYAEPGSEELLSIYLKEMGKYELLTPEREEELSKADKRWV
jgi:RNA polymerase primary sigma factor